MSKNIRKIIKKVINEHFNLNEGPTQGWATGQMGFGKSRDYETLTKPGNTDNEVDASMARLEVAIDKFKSNLRSLGMSSIPDLDGFYTIEMLETKIPFDIEFTIRSLVSEKWDEYKYEKIKTKAIYNKGKSDNLDTIVLELKNGWEMIFDKKDIVIPIPGTNESVNAIRKGNKYDVKINGEGVDMIFESEKETLTTTVKINNLNGLDNPKEDESEDLNVTIRLNDGKPDNIETDEQDAILTQFSKRGLTGTLTKSKKFADTYVFKLQGRKGIKDAILIEYKTYDGKGNLIDLTESGNSGNIGVTIKDNMLGSKLNSFKANISITKR